MSAQPKYRSWEAAVPEIIPLGDRPNLLSSSNKGGLFAYLGAVFSNMARELALGAKKDSACAICSDAIHSTQVESEDEGRPVHAACLEMKSRKRALLESAQSRGHGCSLCGQKVPPTGIFFHEGGATLSYACAEPAHDEPNRFSFAVTTDESRRVGMWEARLRERLKQKGYVRCCECGRMIRAEESRLLGQGWHYCGCLPELWRTGP